ncbi:hypothetical protein CPB84DRAFT_1814520 [Gymnopilus junonius]|uniref:Uncharacterized protein n=1 Tax=Gymnopilus junonius TaxID=109634 RepID=A0A9P5TP73_GYMJU|nr:hypothetical protein CPB84DRAFT_1814520 [Gymnopilus junonius]
MATSDSGYTILLAHLHDPTSKLSLGTLQGALAHHLATTLPIPTPLAATAISSPFYLSQPFRAKTRSKLSSILGRTMQAAMGQWVTDVSKGVHGGHPVLRLAALSGLLLGVEDVKIGDRKVKKEGIDVGSARSGVEDETIVALAEVMDTYAYGVSSSSSNGVEEWEREFQPAGQDILSLALILASQSLTLITQNKLKALPLTTLARLLTLTISSAFKAGTFLSSASASVTLSPNHQVHISGSSQLAQTLQSMSSSPLTISIASISRLSAKVLALLIDAPSSRLYVGLRTISECFGTLQDVVKQIEHDWISCPLANVTDLDIAADSKDLTKSAWTNLKTLLFSIIMLTEAVLSASVFIPPQPFDITPASIAIQTLHIFSHLSFVISEFGGVTTTTRGFEHLKKTFYLALDILAQGDGAHGDSGFKAESYVQQLCFSLSSQRAESAATPPRRAKQAFALASIEQLVPVLSDKCIRDWIWGICYPHLSDPSHRETFESAHSVVLAIFASHAQRQQSYPAGTQISDDSETPSRSSKILAGVMNSDNGVKNVGPETESHSRVTATGDQSGLSAAFVKRMVPFYASCLIDVSVLSFWWNLRFHFLSSCLVSADRGLTSLMYMFQNSKDGKLNTSQLRLAYSALVRSASVSAYATSGPPDDMFTLAWYCVQLLLDTINELSSTGQGLKGKGKALEDDEKSTERLHRLQLMLIASVSSLPLTLMLRALDEIRQLISAYPEDDNGVTKLGDKGKKAELVETLFSELLEKTGDREKEAAMRWWYKYRPTLVPECWQRRRLANTIAIVNSVTLYDGENSDIVSAEPCDLPKNRYAWFQFPYLSQWATHCIETGRNTRRKSGRQFNFIESNLASVSPVFISFEECRPANFISDRKTPGDSLPR